MHSAFYSILFSRQFRYRSCNRPLPVCNKWIPSPIIISFTLQESSIVHSCLKLNFNRQIGILVHSDTIIPYRRHVEYSYQATLREDNIMRSWLRVELQYFSSWESNSSYCFPPISSSRISQKMYLSTSSSYVTPRRDYCFCNHWLSANLMVALARWVRSKVRWSCSLSVSVVLLNCVFAALVSWSLFPVWR